MSRAPDRAHRGFSRKRLHRYLAVYAVLIALCIGQFVAAGDFSLGRRPWENLKQTARELSTPSVVKLWFGNPRLEYRSDDGQMLRSEDERATEARFLEALASATWTTFKIATLGSLLAALLALPFGIAAARNMHLPAPLPQASRALLGASRSIHTLVFGLIIVGIIGLGPMAGVLAIAAHSFGSYGKLYAETIEGLDARWIESGLALGLKPIQILVHGLRRTLLPRWLSIHLYLWEFNMRDSTVLGLIGAGGLGLLVSEAVSLFQWGRLSTLLITTIALVMVFDAISRKLRHDLA